MPSDARDANARSKASCDACRRRKVKCDSAERGEGTPCSKCEASEIECKFTYTRKKRRPNLAPRSRKYGIDTAQVLVEHIVSSLDDYSIPQDSETIREMLVSLAKYARSLELQIKRPSSSRGGRTANSPIVLSGESTSPESNNRVSPDFISLSDTSDKEDSGDEGLLADFKTLSIGPQERHFGRSSNYLFLHTAMEIKVNHSDTEENKRIEKIIMRPEFWLTDIWKWVPEPELPAYKFPDNDLLFALIDIYFTEISPYLCLLHQSTFKDAVASGIHLVDPSFGATVLAVCALASRHSDDPRNHINQTDYEQLVGWKWFRQIRLVRPHFVNTTSVYELQLYCLACEFLSSTTIADACWPLVGLGIRLAQERGAHRAKPGQPRTPESELWLRAFWCLMGMDVMQGLSFGRPPATTPTDCDVEQVAECDDEFWRSTFGKPFVQPSGKPSTKSFAVHYNRLLQIAGAIQRTIYAIKRSDVDQLEFKHHHGTSNIEWNQRIVVKHDSALNDWLDSLPEHLRWDPHRTNQVFFCQTVILHTTFYWVQIQLHKKFVMRLARPPCSESGCSPESGTGTGTGTGSNTSSSPNLANLEMKMSFPSLAVCANAARSTVNIAQAHHQRGLHPLPGILSLLANTAAILLVTLWRSKHTAGGGSAASRRELADLQKCFAILKDYENRHQACGRIVDKFSALLRAEHLDSAPDPPQASGVKRNRPVEEAEEEQDITVAPVDWPSGALEGHSSLVNPAVELSGKTPTPAGSDSVWSEFYTIFNSNNPTYNSNSNVSVNGFVVSDSGFATRSAISGLEIWSDQDPVPATGTEANGGAGLGMPDISLGPQSQTRPLRPDELKSGLYDSLYLTDGATNTDTNIFGSVASTGLELPDLNGTTTATTTVTETGSSELEPIATLNTTDLEDWNTFMRNVDEALFEVGVGR